MKLSEKIENRISFLESKVGSWGSGAIDDRLYEISLIYKDVVILETRLEELKGQLNDK